jgi:hypothetical protein
LGRDRAPDHSPLDLGAHWYDARSSVVAVTVLSSAAWWALTHGGVDPVVSWLLSWHATTVAVAIVGASIFTVDFGQFGLSSLAARRPIATVGHSVRRTRQDLDRRALVSVARAPRHVASGVVVAAHGFGSRHPIRARAPRVHWFRTWNDVLDDALDALPEPSGCSRATLRTLSSDQPVPKRHALVTRGDDLVGLLSLRRRPGYWEPVTDGILPWVLFPAMPGEHAAVTRLLSRRIVFEEPEFDPVLVGADIVEPFEAFSIDLGRAEEHWRSTSLLRDLEKAERRTRRLRMGSGDHGDIDAIVRLWADRWAFEPDGVADQAYDLRSFAHSMLDDGKLIVVALYDGTRLAAGRLVVERDGDEASGLCLARRMIDGVPSAGNRVLEISTRRAAAAGYRRLAIGGFNDYKARWGDLVGVRRRLTIEPSSGDRRRRQRPGRTEHVEQPSDRGGEERGSLGR